jgi:DNA-binding Lrp family transcriptional regulator
MTVSDEALLDVIRRHDCPVVDAATVADAVDLSRERVRLRLNRLAEDGAIERATLNRNSVVFWEPTPPSTPA